MKKKSSKRLALSRETVSHLDDTLRGIAGGCGCPTEVSLCGCPTQNSDCPTCNTCQIEFD